MHLFRHLFCAIAILTIATTETATSDKQILAERAHASFLSGKLEDALWTYKKLLQLLADSPTMHTKILYNIACTLKTMGLMQEAVGVYEKVVAAQPEHHMAHIGLAKAYLATENFQRGWQEFEWRYADPKRHRQPKYDVTTFAGKKIMVLAEWGFGDTMQFIRYARLLKKAGATVIVETYRPLMQLFSLCPYIDAICDIKEERKPVCDLRIPMLSLPMIFDTTAQTIPNSLPYLYSDQQLVQLWKKTFSNDTVNIGLCWQAKPNIFLEQQPRTRRSVALEKFAPLADIVGVRFYSLQQQHGTEQLNKLPEGFVVHEFGPDFDNTHGRFMDTAAVIENLDLIISVDTSIVHLAGALGAQVWVLIPQSAEWRWMLDRTDTSWYPGMQLFRQPKTGDWSPVIKAVREQLKLFVKTK